MRTWTSLARDAWASGTEHDRTRTRELVAQRYNSRVVGGVAAGTWTLCRLAPRQDRIGNGWVGRWWGRRPALAPRNKRLCHRSDFENWSHIYIYIYLFIYLFIYIYMYIYLCFFYIYIYIYSYIYLYFPYLFFYILFSFFMYIIYSISARPYQ